MTTATENQTVEAAELPAELKTELWGRIGRRLSRGEVLITNRQFLSAMAREFKRAVKVPASMSVKVALLEMIQSVNSARPETYLTHGIKNAVNRFFRESEARMQGQADARQEMHRKIKQMINQGNTEIFLESIGVEIDGGVSPAIERAIVRIIDGKKLRAQPRRERPASRRRRSSGGMASVHTAAMEAVGSEMVDPPAVSAATEEEQQERVAEEKKRFEITALAELERAPKNLDAYRQQDFLNDEEVTDLRTLYNIDERLANGEIDEAEANRLREEIQESVREKLQERLREAVDNSIHYVNAFEALKRIPDDRYEAMRFLIKHKNLAVSEEEDVDLSPVAAALEKEDADDLLENLGVLMERKDHELRMIGANMPPYRHIHTLGQKLGKYTVLESFVDELTEVDRDAYSDRLNSDDAEQRVKTAADLKSIVALFTMFFLPTPFHKMVRRLRILLRVRKIYDGAADDRDGRNKVQQFIKRRLMNLYPDLTKEEHAEIEAAANALVEERAPEEGAEKEDRTKRVYRV